MLKQAKARNFLAYSSVEYSSVENQIEHLKANLDVNSPLYIYTLPKLGSKGGTLIKIFAATIDESPTKVRIVDITKKVAFILDESIHTEAFAIPINACNTYTIQRLSKVLYGDENMLSVSRDTTGF